MLQRFTDPNENILWQGKPHRFLYVLGNPLIYPLALCWGLFDLFFMGRFNAASHGFFPHMNLFMLFHMMPVWYAIFSPIYRFLNWYRICLEDDNGLQLHLPGHEPVPLARLNPATLADAYALSIHKSQGSEYPHVALALDEHAERLLSRELLYTGITRSKDRLDIYASADALKNAAATPTRRHTGLAWHLDHPHKVQTNH